MNFFKVKKKNRMSLLLIFFYKNVISNMVSGKNLRNENGKYFNGILGV